MAQVLDKNTEYDNADDSNTWTGDITIDVDTDFFVEGTASISFDLDIETLTILAVSGQYDLRSTHIYAYAMSLDAGLGYKDSGGIRIVVQDSAGNESYWNVGGKDTYLGGWNCFTCGTGEAPDGNNGTDANLNSGIRIGMQWYSTFKSKLAENTYIDYIRYGNEPVIVFGGTSSNPITWEDIKEADINATSGSVPRPVGFVTKQAGVYVVKGPLDFGDDSASSSLYFKDKGSVVVFEDAPVNTDHYNMNVVGNATGYTMFYIGEAAGGVGINGDFLTAAGSSQYALVCSGENVDDVKIYGTIFDKGRYIELASGNSSISNSFNNCGEVYANEATVKYCQFNNPVDRGVEMIVGHNIDNCTFNNCPHGVNIVQSGSFTFDTMTFNNCTYDVELSADSSDIVILATDSNVATYEITGISGTVDIQNAVTLKVTAIDQDGLPVQSALVRMHTTASSTVVLSGYTNTSGIISDSYNYAGEEEVLLRIRRASSGLTKYEPYSSLGTITNAGLTITATLIEDTIAT